MFAVTLPVFSRAVELISPKRGPEPRKAQLSDAIQIEGMEWQVRPIEADGLCWLRTIAAVVRPDLAKGAHTQYLGVVRADLQAEIQRWQRPRWLQDVPWYGVRDWLWETRQEGDTDSFDVCVRLLQQRNEWFSHAVFYLASARYAIDFFLVGIRTNPPAGSPHPLYGRRINLPAIARIKVAVWHSGDHYEPLELPAEYAATVFEQISLLPTVSTNGSRSLDRDKQLLEGEGFQANKRQAVDLAAVHEVKADGVEHGADGADRATSLGVVQRSSSESSHDFSSDDIRAPPADTNKADLTVCRRQSDRPKQKPDFLQQTPPPKKSHTRETEPYWNDAVNKAFAECVECFRLYSQKEYMLSKHKLLGPADATDARVLGGCKPAPPTSSRSKKELKYMLCNNEYCVAARARLATSLVAQLSPTVCSPPAYKQCCGWVHTGMCWLKGGEDAMWRIEQQRYPWLRADDSRIKGSGRGVFVAPEHTLQTNQIVCSMLGQIRATKEETSTKDAHDTKHPLYFDPGLAQPDGFTQFFHLRLFPHTFAAIINSSLNKNGQPLSEHPPNCIFAQHPHFYQHEDYYLKHRRVWPCGAYCVRVAPGCTIRAGEELYIRYAWGHNRYRTSAPKALAAAAAK